MSKETLTNKQKRFCEEYIRDWNGTRAAIAAGYSKATAKQQASQLLDKTLLSDFIQKLQEDFQKQAKISFLSQVDDIREIITDEETTNREKMDGIKELNKMFGFYATEKKDINIKTEQPLFGDGEE